MSLFVQWLVQMHVWRIVLVRHGQNGYLYVAKLQRRADCRRLWFEQGCRGHVLRRHLQPNRTRKFQAYGRVVSFGVRAWFPVRRQSVRTPALLTHSLSRCTTTLWRPLPSVDSLCLNLHGSTAVSRYQLAHSTFAIALSRFGWSSQRRRWRGFSALPTRRPSGRWSNHGGGPSQCSESCTLLPHNQVRRLCRLPSVTCVCLAIISHGISVTSHCNAM